jgi:hypothetical protein
MAEIHGSLTRIYANGIDISSLFREAEYGRTRALVNTEAFGATSDAFIPSPASAGDLSAAGMLDVDPDTGAQAVKDMLDASAASLTGTSVIVAMSSDAAIGDDGFALVGSMQQHRVKQPLKDVVQTTFEATANRSAWVKALHPLAARTTAYSSVGLDAGALSSYGGLGTLIVTAISGASPVLTAKLQHSSDSTNGVDGAWVDLGTFASITTASVAAGYGDHELVADGTVNRWLRVNVAVTSGSLTSCTFHCAFGRYTSNH